MNKNIVIKKTFNFGKIAYIGKRRTCPADVELTLYLENGHYELAIVGNIWNHLHTNAYIGGQCLEEMREYITAPTFNRLYSLWKSYHLNGLHAGTHRQEEALKQANIHDYAAACDYLKRIGLFVDTLSADESLDYENEHAKRDYYEYGYGWIRQEIPSAVIDEIFALCGVEVSKAA